MGIVRIARDNVTGMQPETSNSLPSSLFSLTPPHHFTFQPSGLQCAHWPLIRFLSLSLSSLTLQYFPRSLPVSCANVKQKEIEKICR